jgi:hypothetical protein
MLKEPPGSDEASSRRGGPCRERRFLGNEWSVDVWFGSGAESIKTARELPALAIATLAAHPDFADAPLYVVTDVAGKRLVAIPCWEIFRVYYAGAPRVARLLFDFPRWKVGTPERMLRSFDGHQFFGPARPSAARCVCRTAAAGRRSRDGRCVRHDGSRPDPGRSTGRWADAVEVCRDPACL